MSNDEISPWRVQRALTGSAAMAEAILQRDHVESLLGTSLSLPMRAVLRTYHEELVAEIRVMAERVLA